MAQVNREIDRIIAEIEQKPDTLENLKSYYTDRTTAETCEAWRSCARWAFEQYAKDQSFKITKASLKNTTRRGRHNVSKQNVLHIEAIKGTDTLYVIFFTPHYTRGRPAFRYVKRSSK